MPNVFRAGGFRFFFYSNEGLPREPHVHVENGQNEAKFWLQPAVAVAYNDGFNARTLRVLLSLVEANHERIEQAWIDFFG